MLTKEAVSKQIAILPEQFTLDELIERLIVIEKIEDGLKQVKDNQVLSEVELDKEMKKWFK